MLKKLIQISLWIHFPQCLYLILRIFSIHLNFILKPLLMFCFQLFNLKTPDFHYDLRLLDPAAFLSFEKYF